MHNSLFAHTHTHTLDLALRRLVSYGFFHSLISLRRLAGQCGILCRTAHSQRQPRTPVNSEHRTPNTRTHSRTHTHNKTPACMHSGGKVSDSRELSDCTRPQSAASGNGLCDSRLRMRLSHSATATHLRRAPHTCCVFAAHTSTEVHTQRLRSGFDFVSSVASSSGVVVVVRRGALSEYVSCILVWPTHMHRIHTHAHTQFSTLALAWSAGFALCVEPTDRRRFRFASAPSHRQCYEHGAPACRSAPLECT